MLRPAEPVAARCRPRSRRYSSDRDPDIVLRAIFALKMFAEDRHDPRSGAAFLHSLLEGGIALCRFFVQHSAPFQTVRRLDQVLEGVDVVLSHNYLHI